MNVASLSLCKELFVLSGWNDTFGYYEGWRNNDLMFVGQDIGMYDAESAMPNYKKGDTPAYDLSFILNRLPVYVGDGYYFSMERTSNEWSVGYQAYGEYARFYQYAETPEDAACLLAIDLFKQGILQKSTSISTQNLI